MQRLKINPVPKPRMTSSDKWNKRPCVMRYWEYKKKLLLLKPEVDWDNLTMEFHIEMPESWSDRKKTDMFLKPHKSKPDLSNLVKGFEDALLLDDSKVWRYNLITKVWDYSGLIIIY